MLLPRLPVAVVFISVRQCLNATPSPPARLPLALIFRAIAQRPHPVPMKPTLAPLPVVFEGVRQNVNAAPAFPAGFPLPVILLARRHSPHPAPALSPLCPMPLVFFTIEKSLCAHPVRPGRSVGPHDDERTGIFAAIAQDHTGARPGRADRITISAGRLGGRNTQLTLPLDIPADDRLAVGACGGGIIQNPIEQPADRAGLIDGGGRRIQPPDSTGDQHQDNEHCSHFAMIVKRPPPNVNGKCGEERKSLDS